MASSKSLKSKKPNSKERLTTEALKIIIREGRIRQVFDKQKLEQLKKSILEVGQLQPIIVDRDMNLIVGERRTRSCVDLARPVWYVFADTLDPVLLKQMELDENIYRADLTPSEIVLAKAELREVREAQGKGTSHRQLAQEMNESATQVAEDLKIASYVKVAPQLFDKCKTKADLKKVIKRMENRATWKNLMDAAEALEQKDAQAIDPQAYRVDAPQDISKPIEEVTQKTFIERSLAKFSKALQVGDAYEELDKLQGVHVMFLDPPWGIDHDEKQDMSIHKDGKYADSKDKFKEDFPKLCELAFSAMADDSHLYCFFAIVHTDFVYDSLEKAGFQVNRRPIIICKEGISSTRVPDIWPGAGYEPIAFARKGQRALVQRGKPDWILCKWLAPEAKMGHPSAKPPVLFQELLRRSAYPGDLICDPMYGTGSVFVGCELVPDLKLQWVGWDIAKENKSKAIANLTNMLMKGE